MTPLNVRLQELIDQVEADLPEADPVAKIGEARLRSRTLVDLGDQLVDHYVHAARAEGASWSQIGDVLGVTKQAAQQRRSDGQFERYTPRARHVVILAQDRARTLKHTDINGGHLLLGLLGEPDGIAAKALVMLAGSLDAVSEAAHARLTPGDNDTNVKAAERVESYRGFVFASLAADGPSLIDWGVTSERRASCAFDRPSSARSTERTV